MAHEGLQIYTVGHLLPRGTVDNGAWNSSPDTGAGTNVAFIIGAEEQRLLLQQQNEFGNNGNGGGYSYEGSNRGSVETEEEETVQPTHNNTPPSSTRGSQSSSSTLVPSNQFVGSAGPSSSSSASSSTTTRKLRVRRSTFVPGWAVPPRVLLVDDDAVTRKLSSKFLQVFGCTIDVAVDGVGAVNKMNLEKYDLVLMDIVMPKLDGVSATSLIRKFDCMTPIISMTSNSKPNEILNYFSSGMNDILPKPFTKQGLLDMLEKHLTHLRAIQEMSRVPRPLELPNAEGSSSYLQNNSLTSDSSMVSLSSQNVDDDGRINPIAGLGLTDEQYNLIVQDIVNAETFGAGMEDGTSRLSGPASGGMMDGPMGMMNMTTILMGEKRGLEEPSSDGREGKRSRFEVIE
ncbi:CheY-like superfamily [Amanita muscaria]